MATEQTPQKLHARLRLVMQESDLNITTMAKAASSFEPCSANTMAAYLKDGKRGMRPAHAYSLADATGFSARWIQLGQGSPLGLDGDLPHPHRTLVRHLRIVVAGVEQLATISK